MLKAVRLVGSVAFVVGFFAILFVAIPWFVTVLDSPDIGGPLPWWLRVAVYLVVGGIAVVLAMVAIEQRGTKAGGEKAPEAESSGLVLSNSDQVIGREVAEVLGLVQGHTIFAIWLGKDLSALVRLLLGGELVEYTQMMGKARAVALSRMQREARERGADAVINVRLMTTSVVGSAAELLAYGTAVKLG